MNKKIVFGREDVRDFFFSYFLGMGRTKILGFPLDSGKESTCQCRRHGFDPWGQEDPLEKEMATQSSILAWKIPWTEKPGGLQPMGVAKESDMA